MVTEKEWAADGKPFVMCQPLLDLRATLGKHGYKGPQTGYPDDRHLFAAIPEDHCPFSHTPWPGPQPYPHCMALDIMPDPAVDWIKLGTKLVADKNAGKPGTQPIKYINWTDSAGRCWNDSWQGGHTHVPSTDSGHIHVSIRTDYVSSHIMATYDPLEDDMAFMDDPNAAAMAWRIEAIINNRPTVTGGPRVGEVNALHDAIAAIATPQVDASAVAAALAADTVFLTALAKAVNDDAAARLAE